MKPEHKQEVWLTKPNGFSIRVKIGEITQMASEWNEQFVWPVDWTITSKAPWRN